MFLFAYGERGVEDVQFYVVDVGVVGYRDVEQYVCPALRYVVDA